ncbi:30S ribosomal protein S4 [Mycoplasma capricolum subsp. capripneumoniae]|uniref:Small ribosomal subunit protein uS4 n=1 Tax=Mycoplasma capricolum subsp. capripneumoniae 87001 TaxID=1124992 RepID=A0A9N7ASE0_MYCCC|nr:30S ribosomal protein S4 [Mycoplasma capricolum]AJK51273.1 30S ribosomal protein S4 [Mycoplasma capricolum subsp. capripneumoniae 87001]AOQ21985.1 30S ribosomal protein S4 [Mycoplasma capricolum subsp. capripneumoniae M1601]AQU77398.1 30S ribosomal protein S4 [Mycoplasma capricolum subsp. capripneumoniae]KEY84285.1 30S ribosomal protein S4 [Mycoplasma capricolum subsp. capripneumoniae 99108]QDL19468.1 30S ribosomal protein S4 [Mycoplasma capricolum subsp. capripneumoniae]
MSRFIGSTFKKSRRFGFSILETGKEFSKGKKRITTPGQHGKERAKVKVSEYGQQLQEKQKVKFMYGLSERQFRNTFAKAKKMQGILGTNFLVLLESRLDNIVYRLGFSATRQGARQLVNHGHILVNGKKVDIPSYLLSVGDLVEVKASMKKNEKVLEALQNNEATLEFVKVNKSEVKGEFIRLPERNELNSEISESLIVEWYNRLIKK